MSTGRRLAKRSIIGTKVCALSEADGLWYSGVIQDVKTCTTATTTPTALDTTINATKTSANWNINANNIQKTITTAATTTNVNLNSNSNTNTNSVETCSETRYVVRFDFKTQLSELKDHDLYNVGGKQSKHINTHNNIHINPVQTLRRNAMIKEFRETELIGPGFRSINGIKLQCGQRIYITHNGRETSGDVLTHDTTKDEVLLKITLMGYEEPIVLKKRLEEVRLLESRRSARLAYQERNTDFARLADMAGGEKRRTSYSQEVKSLSSLPSSSSSSSSSSLSPSSSSSLSLLSSPISTSTVISSALSSLSTPLSSVSMAATAATGGTVAATTATTPTTTTTGIGAKEITSLTPQHHSRKRPPSNTYECFNYDAMADEEEMNECNAAMILVTLSLSPKSPKNAEKWLGSSPGSSSASWSSGSSSPPLSDDGHNILGATNINDATTNARNRTTSVSTSDEGIVVDFKEEIPRRKRANKTKFVCTYPGCKLSEHTKGKIERHIRLVHLSHKKPRRSLDQNDDYFIDSDSHEEEFYYTEIEDEDDDCKTPSPASPPTLSHRDMARPPHEDPEYQRQLVGNLKQNRINQQQQQQLVQKICNKTLHGNSYSQQRQPHNTNNNVGCMPTSPLACHNYTWVPNSSTSIAPVSSVYVNNNAIITLQQQPTQQHPTQNFIKQVRASSSQSATSCPSPTYVQQHKQQQNYKDTTVVVNNNNTKATKIQQCNDANATAKGVLHQLSQHNITVTACHGGNDSQQTQSQNHQQKQQQQQQQLATVTITPSYITQTVQMAKNSNEVCLQQKQQSQQQQQHQQQQQQQPLKQHISTATTNVGISKTSQENSYQTSITTATKHTPNSPNRRTRGENKKCRKVYGMDRRELWCTQCRWKKACSRFGD